MSTRALYTFKGEEGHYNIYKHHDGYPSGAMQTLQATIDWFAWKLPRYESDEFAAAFCAAAKSYYLIQATESDKNRKEFLKGYGPQGTYRPHTGGGARVMPQGDPMLVAEKYCSDIDYRYEISLEEGDHLHIKCFGIGEKFSDIPNTIRYSGTFKGFCEWVAKEEVA